MRKIIFRGKDRTGIMDHSWQVGALDNTNAEFPKIIRLDRCGNQMIIDVLPETVGQFTGLTDKNGKKIFEGDILSYIEEIETRSKGKEILKGIYEVKFEYCGFSPLDCLACNHLEIIGNVHDNPELLKGDEE